MNRVPVTSEGEATTAPGRAAISGRAGAGPVGGSGAGGAPGYAGSREGAPAQPERRRSAAAAAHQYSVRGIKPRAASFRPGAPESPFSPSA
jgi:hypothetical protein